MTNSAATTVIKNPTWWKRRSQLERMLVLMTAIVTFFCALLVVCLGLTTYYKDFNFNESLPSMEPLQGSNNVTIRAPGPNEPEICLSEGCIHAASDLLKIMDFKANPCDDFYQFVCGGFNKQVIPDDKSSISTFSVINDELQTKLRTVFTRPATPKDTKPFVMVKNLYGACMNKSAVEAAGNTRVLEMLKEAGGWPVLEGDEWDEASFDWRQLIYKYRKIGFSVDYLIDFSITPDYKNSTYRVIDIDQASLALNRQYLIKGLDNKLVKAYYSYMVDIAVLFGAERERAQQELKDSLDFEIKLANISLPIEERRNSTKLYNPMTIEEAGIKFPTIPWLEYLNNVLSSPTVQLTSSERIIVAVPTYFTELENLLQHTPKRVVANYLLWRAAASTVSYLNEAFRNRQLKYATAVSGRTESSPRWQECVDLVSSTLGLASGSLYVRNFFKEEAKQSALEMVAGIREEMYKILEDIDWMDEETRKNALEKARAMSTHIAYPDEILDDNKLIEFYEDLHLTNESYFDAIMNVTRFGTQYNFNKLRKKINKTEWISHGRPAVVNAFYNSIENSIQFPAGILQGAFFSNDRPKYMNYGAIGFVIGHEITHGFDDQGRQFDKDGNLVDWWAPETKSKYLERAQCIIWQYGNYTDRQVNMNLNGINTQGENIADNGGMKQAYRAYKKWASKNGPEPRLPGLQQFTPEQMIWISAATSWCTVTRDEALAIRITTQYHSPGEFRVRGPLSNREEFSKDFNCPLGSTMNPVKKCQVW